METEDNSSVRFIRVQSTFSFPIKIIQNQGSIFDSSNPFFFVLFNYKYFVLKLDVHVLINWQYLANEFRLCSNYPIGTITDDKSMSYHKWHALFYQAVARNEPVNSVLPRSLSSSDEMAIGTMISFISHLKWSILCLIGRFEGRKLPIYEIVWAITDENTPIKLKIIELIDGHKHFSTQ